MRSLTERGGAGGRRGRANAPPAPRRGRPLREGRRVARPGAAEGGAEVGRVRARPWGGAPSRLLELGGRALRPLLLGGALGPRPRLGPSEPPRLLGEVEQVGPRRGR